jgi:hypothetical protein
MIAIVAALSILVTTNTTNSQRRTATRAKKPPALDAEQIAKKILPSVVLIECEDGRGNTSIGSGFFVATGRPRRFMIVTAYHVIKGMVRGTWRTPSDEKVPGRAWPIGAVLNNDEQSDYHLVVETQRDDVARGILIKKLKLWKHEKEQRAFIRNKDFISVEVRELIFGLKTNTRTKTLVTKVARKFCPKITVRTIERGEIDTGTRGEVDT